MPICGRANGGVLKVGVLAVAFLLLPRSVLSLCPWPVSAIDTPTALAVDASGNIFGQALRPFETWADWHRGLSIKFVRSIPDGSHFDVFR